MNLRIEELVGSLSKEIEKGWGHVKLGEEVKEILRGYGIWFYRIIDSLSEENIAWEVRLVIKKLSKAYFLELWKKRHDLRIEKILHQLIENLEEEIKESKALRIDAAGRRWGSKLDLVHYQFIIADSGCPHHFYFCKNRAEMEEMMGENQWEIFSSLKEFEEWEDWIYAERN